MIHNLGKCIRRYVATTDNYGDPVSANGAFAGQHRCDCDARGSFDNLILLPYIQAHCRCNVCLADGYKFIDNGLVQRKGDGTGFDPAGGVAASTDAGVLSLRLVYCLGPVVFYGLAMKLIWSYPLTPARHARLRDRLERRNARLAALQVDPEQP